jgi:serine/threonine-protein kinase
MLSRLGRGLLFVAYGLVVVAVFALSAYVSFSLFVRSGVTTVPAVRGMSRADAAAELADNGLRVRRSDSPGRYDNEVPAGRVVQQDPDPRTLVKRGSSVEIVLSRGPQRVEVPELAGKTLPAAQAALSGAGLAIGRILGAFARDGAEGAVLGHDPDAGESIPPATPVDLLLVMSVQRERFIMPDLVYRDYEQVRRFFHQRRFTFGTVRFERYEGVAAGVILRQFPLAGHPLTRQDPISLVVATADILPTDEAPTVFAPPPPPATPTPVPSPPATPTPPAAREPR